MSKKLGLALSGGGARGVVHIGFLKALEEEGIKPYCISGTSMGAVVGGAYACGISPDRLHDIIIKLKMSDILDITALPFSRLALLRSKKLQKLLLRHIGSKSFEELNMPFSCTAVDLYNEKLYVFESGSVEKAVRASSCIPGIFRPVEHEGMLLIDGGVLCRVPVRETKRLGADVVVAVDAIKNTAEPVTEIPNLVSMLLRVFDTLDNTLVRRERAETDYPCDLLLEPEMKGISQYLVKNLEVAYEEGYKLGKENADKIRALMQD